MYKQDAASYKQPSKVHKHCATQLYRKALTHKQYHNNVRNGLASVGLSASLECVSSGSVCHTPQPHPGRSTILSACSWAGVTQCYGLLSADWVKL